MICKQIEFFAVIILWLRKSICGAILPTFKTCTGLELTKKLSKSYFYAQCAADLLYLWFLKLLVQILTRLIWVWEQLFQFIFSCLYEIYSSLVQRFLFFFSPAAKSKLITYLWSAFCSIVTTATFDPCYRNSNKKKMS